MAVIFEPTLESGGHATMSHMDPIPQHWTTASEKAQGPDGRSYALRLWGWSTTSLGHAAQVAAERVFEVAQRIRAGQELGRGGYYPRLPLREEVLEEIRSADGTLVAAITRNRYGAEVLNTDAVLIADVDLPGSKARTRFARLMGGIFGSRGDTGAGTSEGGVLAHIDEYARTHPDLGVSTYRTAAGFRVLITGAHALPESPEAQQIMRDLATDPVYVTLCATHRTYRARLTPKPWRCGMKALGPQWPWADGPTAEVAATWIERYRQASSGYVVCERIRRGAGVPSPEEALVLGAHDRAVLGSSGLALA